MKKLFSEDILKYVNPYITFQVSVEDVTKAGRALTKTFTFRVDDSGEIWYPMDRFKAGTNVNSPTLQFAQESELYIKIGDEGDPFPPDKYDILVQSGNVTLDDDGNLFISENPLNGFRNVLKFFI
jgi:hypothetical protein